tara:strand:- start:339 stop:638 length:300 start_codon:yes stop_codon:yes gene_type:complete
MIKNMMNNRAQMGMGELDPNSVNDALQANQNQGGTNRILSGMPQKRQGFQTDRNFAQFQNISGASTLPINPVYSETAKFNQLGGTSEVDPSNGQNIQMT